MPLWCVSALRPMVLQEIEEQSHYITPTPWDFLFVENFARDRRLAASRVFCRLFDRSNDQPSATTEAARLTVVTAQYIPTIPPELIQNATKVCVFKFTTHRDRVYAN